MDEYKKARENMVKGQLLPENITDKRVIEAISDVPRHIFAPDNLWSIAYADTSVPLGNGRYMLPPVTFALMLQEAGIKTEDRVLDLGCSSGYSSAVLSILAKKVVSVEPCPEFASKAHTNLNRLKTGNVIILGGDITDGCQESAPYDVIIINGTIEEVPGNLFEQLAEGGKLVAPIAKDGGISILCLYKKTGKIITESHIKNIVSPRLAQVA